MERDWYRVLRNYTPKKAHKKIDKIKDCVTPEERHFWWKLIHKIVSTKKTESKYKRDQFDNLVSSLCPLCHQQEESRLHYEYDCPTLSRFRQQTAHLLGKEDFIYDEWILETTQGTEATLLIAKARWAFHCERCNIDQNRRNRLILEVFLAWIQRRIQMATDTVRKVLDIPA